MNEYLAFAQNVAKEAGEIMLKYFQLGGVKQKTKSDQSIVTIADEEINALVIKRVEETFPNLSVFGEEGSVNKSSKLIWACDPIDGTVPYAKGVPFCAFSLALVDDGTPVVGVVYDPFMKRLYSAVKGEGAFVNGKKISASKLPLSYDATVNIEWWPEADYDLDTAMHKLTMETQSYVLHGGSVVNAGSLVAAGQYEACLFTGTKGKNVDIAALKVIVEEAGGKVTDLFGNDQRYDGDIKGAVISNGVVHQDILKYTKGLAMKP